MLPATYVRRLDASDGESAIDVLAFEIVLAERLARGDLVLCTEGELVPADGMIVAGQAQIGEDTERDWRAHTARGLGIAGGSRVIAGHLVVRVGA